MTYAKRRFHEIEQEISNARFACQSKGEYIKLLAEIIQSTSNTIGEVQANYPNDYDWLNSEDEWYSSDCAY